ncbi:MULTISPECIES: transposase [Bacillaceae]|uniref:transposase n=1 Tax=Bacillaceae TaxID=186817 RepID=UPI001F2B2491|nr:MULTISPECIES: transposase [Bacillaceae]
MGKRRVWIPLNYHHVSNRGNRREAIFQSAADYIYFLNLIENAHEKFSIKLCSYCLMTNHYHLQLLSTDTPISKVMFYINKKYANYYNRKYKYTGHLFEKPFFSRPVYDDYDILALSRYIHLNPVKATMVHLPEEYRWSSYSYFLSSEAAQPPSFFTFDPILSQFSGNTQDKKKKYLKWMMKAHSYEESMDYLEKFVMMDTDMKQLAAEKKSDY